MKRITLLLLCCIPWSLSPLPTSRAAEEPAPNTLTEQEKKDGWKLLFDGKTLDGWRRYKKQDAEGWSVKDGCIYLEKSGSGDLMTKEKYGDFEFSIDWKFVKGNNSGIVYRVTEEDKGPPYMSGPEMQVMPHKVGDKLGKNSGGSLYDMYAPTSNTFKPVEEWNTFKIVAKGNHIEQWVNGTKIVECEIGSEAWNKILAGSKWKDAKLFATQATGHFSLQDHGANLLFRNVKIKTAK